LDETRKPTTEDANTTSECKSDCGPGVTAAAHLRRIEVRIGEYVDYWVPLLGLSEWNIDVLVSNRFEDAGSNVTERRYEHMTIGFNPQRIIEQGHDRDLEELVVHELAHAFTWRLWDIANKMVAQFMPGNVHKLFDDYLEDYHEKAVTEIGKALVRTRRHCASLVD